MTCYFTLSYNNSDDGIWLSCVTEPNGWVPHHDDLENLGYWPSPEDVQAAVDRHRKAHS